MRKRSLNFPWLAIISVLFLSSPGLASHQPQSSTNEESAVRALMSQWVDAYRHLDAKRLAMLEMSDVEIVDHFGELHLPSGRNENEQLWSDSFEMVSRNTVPPSVTIDHIQFLRPDVALVQSSWQFAEGILLVDGQRIPPFLQTDTYVLIRSHGSWLVAVHNIQEKKH
jgi:uncharacterized protein (TIGR02246 family)